MPPSSDDTKVGAPPQDAPGTGGGAAGTAPVVPASPTAAAPAPAPAKAGAAPAFKNPVALTEPTKEMLVPFGMVFGASTLSWIAGRLGLSVMFSFIFGGGVAYAITTLRDRLTKAATIFAERNAQRKRVIGDEESAEWINAVLYRFWQFYEPVLCEQIRASVEPVLKDLKVPGLTGIALQRFTLGKNPPFVSSAKFLLRDNHNNKISEDRMVLNLGIGLHAPELEVVVAAQTAVASLPICVKEVWFEGLLRLEIELVPEFPHAKTVLVTFLEKPIIDFNIVPLKSVNIMEIPGLAQLLSGLIINGVNDNLVNPEKLLIDLMPAECGKVEASKGLLLVTVDNATYKEPSAFDISLTSQEVLVEVKVGREEVRTSPCVAKGGATEFVWKESVGVLVKGNLAAEKVTLYLKQKKMSGERLLGKAYVPLADIVNSPGGTVTEKLELENGNGFINLKLDFKALANLSVDEEGDAAVAESATETKDTSADESSVVMVTPGLAHKGKSGALLMILHGARDLPAADSNGFSDPYVKVFYTGEKIAKTPVVTKSLSPKFDFNKEWTVADVDHVKLTLCVFDHDDMGGDDALADLDVDLSALFPSDAEGNREFRVEKKWFPLRKPGPVELKKEVTAADLKRGGSAKDVKAASGFGHMQLTLIFRPADVPSDATFQAALGNPEDDLSVTPYGRGNALSKGAAAMGKGLTAGVGLVGSGVGAVGSGLATGVTGAAGLMGKGLTEAVSLTGKAGSGVTKHMSSFTPKAPGKFFMRRKSNDNNPPATDNK